LIEQHDHDQRELDDGRHELHDHHAHDGLDGIAAALEDPCQAAGLALEVKAQRELVHVLEGAKASRRTAFIATFAKMPSRAWVSSAIRMRVPP
jgi:hypothetical protein